MALELKTTKNSKGMKFASIVYGPAGIGKTSMALEYPNPLVIDLEGGITTLRDEDIPYFTVSTIEEVDEAIEYAKNSKYETIFFDSFTMLESILIQYYADKSNTEMPQLQDYHKLNLRLNKTMLKLRNLRYSGKNVVITMLEMLLKIEQSDQSLITMTYPMLKASGSTLIQKLVGDMDVVARMEMGKNERFLRIKSTEQVFAKDRIRKNGTKAIKTKNLFKEEK